MRQAIGRRLVVLIGPSAQSRAIALYFAAFTGVVGMRDAGTGVGGHTELVSEILARLDACLRDPGERLLLPLARLGSPDQVVIYAGSYPTVAKCGLYTVIGSRPTVPEEIESKAAQFTILPPHTIPNHQRCPALVANRRCAEMVKKGSVVAHAANIGDVATMATAAARFVAADSSPEQCERILSSLNARGDIFLCQFVPGTPVTVYGYVTDRSVVVSGVYEALNEVDLTTGVIYAGGVRGAGVRDSDAALIQHVVSFAIRHSAGVLNYAGAFCIDGVWAQGQFAVLDLNLRSCAGARRLLGDIGIDLPAPVVDLALRESQADDSHDLMIALATEARRHWPSPHDLTLWERSEPITASEEWTAAPGRVELARIVR